jgi:catechol 2,3-dioxygenase-like lactoylglutathione lyase family enzyme
MKNVAAFLFCILSLSSFGQKLSVAIVASDYNKSYEFYTTILGMEKSNSFGLDDAQGKRTGLTNSLPFDVTVMKMEATADDIEWKLLTFKKEGTHPKQQYIHDDTGVQYVTIFVEDTRPFQKRIKKNNIKLLGDTPIKLDDDRTFLLIQDPDGLFIEIIGPE